MNLGCNLKEVKQNTFNNVKKIVEGESKTIRMDNNGTVTFDYSNSTKYKTYEAAFNVAQSKKKAAEEWVKRNYPESIANQNWFQIFSRNNEIILQYQFPSSVQQAVNKYFAVQEQRQEMYDDIQEARQNQIEDAKRAGVVFSDDYLYFAYEDDYDALADPDGYDELGNPDDEYTDLADNVDDISSESMDFTSYQQHKVNLLKKLEEKYESYKRLNKANYGSDKYKSDTYEFQNTINKLADEIANLDINSAENIFQDVINEINYLNNVLNKLNTDTLRHQDIIDRIDFLYQMTTGYNLNDVKVNDLVWNGNEFDNYNTSVYVPIMKLKTKLNDKQREIVRDLLDKDIIFQTHKDNFTEEEIQSLFEEMADINVLQELFLGINSNNDSIVATLLNTTFQTNVQKTKQYARVFNENLKTLDKKLKDKDFSLDNFFEKDESGIDTGNIIHKYSREYFRKLYNYFVINRSFNNAKKESKPAFYNQKIEWLKQNTEVIDFRQLKYFKDVYGEQYADFFTATDEQMTIYETTLRNSLGKLYDYHIQDLEKKLSEYENYKMNEELKNSKWLGKNIYSNSPWVFVSNYYSENAYAQVGYTSGTNTYFTFNNSKFIEFVPKRYTEDVDTGLPVETGFFNNDFDKVENDEDAFAYWENIREIYMKHINPTYSAMGQNISSLSWAKFERTWSEELMQSEGIKGFFKNIYNETIKGFRQIWYERGFHTEDSGIKSNYTDSTHKEINKIKKLISLKGIKDIQAMADKKGIAYDNLETMISGLNTKDTNDITENYKADLIDKIARETVFENYSRDLTKTTTALSDLATLHKARQETQFISDMLLNFHKSIKDTNNKDRNHSNKKLQSWIDTNIYNQRAVSRGNEKDTLGGVVSSDRFWKYYSDSEKEMMKILQGLKDTSADNVTNYSFFIDDVGYSKKGNKYYQTVEDKSFEMNKEDFESSLQSYINNEIQRLGINLHYGGLFLGVMKTIINKALALNPVSGVFNRSEGMFTNMIRDNMGDFWSRGNLKYAKRFLVFANINKFSGKQLSLQSKQKYLQMQTYQLLLDELSLFQDKKNELDRKDKESRFDAWKEKLNIFQFAVDNPEFKNQSEIVLSMLMDVRIKDKDGNEVKFFDGTGFPVYKPGTLELRDEFRTDENLGWETFSLTENPAFNTFFAEKVRIEDTIKKTQGNYASLDSISFLDNNVGRLLMLFMRWMPEHVNQRFGTRSIDIIQGKKKIAGRYRGLLSNTGATSIFGSIVLGTALGPAGLIAGATAGILPFILKRTYGKFVYGDETSIKDNLLDLQTTIGFMQEVVIQTINLPVKLTYSGKNMDDLITNKKLTENSKLTPTQISALQGMAQEAAIMVSQLMIMILLKSLLWDDEDDDEDLRRQLHNFIDNQGNRSINSLMNWSNPRAFVEDNSKFALLRHIGDVEKFIDFAWKYTNEDKGTFSEGLHKFNKVQPFVPIPNAVSKGVLTGEVPGLDKREYQSSQWFDRYVKGEEWRNEQKLKNKRSKFKELYEENLRQKYEGKNIDDDQIDKIVEKLTKRRLNMFDIKKRKNETSTQALERINFDLKIEELER